MRQLRATTGIGLASLTIVAACTGDGESSPTPVIVTTTTEAPAERVDDGTLRLGAVIPSSDTGVGASLTASVRDSVDAINEAGGVLGRDVELITADEGPTAETASQAIETLVGDDVDAIVGPTSSVSAIGALGTAVSSGIVACSPTASAIALDDFPDDGLFFRTIASDSLQAVAIAEQAELTGARNIAIAHIDDAYGRPYAEAVAEEIDFAELTTVAFTPGDENLRDEVNEVLDSGAPVVIVLGDGAHIAQFLAALGDRPSSTITRVIANDAVRSVDARPIIAELPTELRDKILGVAPQIVLTPDDDEPDPAPFAAQVGDCVNLISLAAIQAQSDNPGVIATQMSSVSSGGSPCSLFEDCATGLANELQINYNGPTGIELGRDGDPTRAWFDRFRFTEDGSDVPDESGRITVRFDRL